MEAKIVNFLFDIKSKNKTSLSTMIYSFFLLLNKFKIFLKLFNKKKVLVKFAILKSPHIHKKFSQKIVGFKIYRKQIALVCFNYLQFIFLLKLVLNKLFFDITIKIVNYLLKFNTILKKFTFFQIYFLNKSNLLNKKKLFKIRLKQLFKFLNIIIIQIL